MVSVICGIRKEGRKEKGQEGGRAGGRKGRKREREREIERNSVTETKEMVVRGEWVGGVWEVEGEYSQ